MQIKIPKFQRSKEIDKAFPYRPKLVYDVRCCKLPCKYGFSLTFYTQEKVVEEYCKSSGRNTEEVDLYLSRRNRYQIYQKKYIKFIEAFWRALFYSAFTILGYCALFVPEKVEWIVDPAKQFTSWPYDLITPMILFYYHIELGCYFHQLLWTDSNHSDALEMMVHHIVTILLIVTSFLTNFYRVGSCILIIHDVSDVFLETAKVFNYSSQAPSRRWMKPYIVDPIFAFFAVTFFITRLVIYPGYIIRSVLTDGYKEFTCDWGGCYVYCGLLFVLQFLHIFWFCLIMRMVYKLATGTMQKDERSDDEDEIPEEKPSLKQKQK